MRPTRTKPTRPGHRRAAATTDGAAVTSDGFHRNHTDHTRAARRRYLFLFVWAFVGVGLMIGAWSLATPLMAAPDEPDHVIQAVAILRGQFDVPKHQSSYGPLEDVKVPQYVGNLPSVPVCFAFHPETSAGCASGIGVGTKTVSVGTQFSNYPPLYYAIVGLPSLFLNGPSALYAMRLMGTVLDAALIALGIWLLLRYHPRQTPLLGALIALSPMALFVMAVVNSSGLEIAAGFASWCGALCVIEYRFVPPRPRRVDSGGTDPLSVVPTSKPARCCDHRHGNGSTRRMAPPSFSIQPQSAPSRDSGFSRIADRRRLPLDRRRTGPLGIAESPPCQSVGQLVDDIANERRPAAPVRGRFRLARHASTELGVCYLDVRLGRPLRHRTGRFSSLPACAAVTCRVDHNYAVGTRVASDQCGRRVLAGSILAPRGCGVSFGRVLLQRNARSSAFESKRCALGFPGGAHPGRRASRRPIRQLRTSFTTQRDRYPGTGGFSGSVVASGGSSWPGLRARRPHHSGIGIDHDVASARDGKCART